jgi:hypothetical protein
MSNISNGPLPADVVASYQYETGDLAEHSGVLQQVPADLLREVAGALLESAS